MYFGIYGASYNIVSLTFKKLLTTQKFEKSLIFQWKDVLANLISSYQIGQTSENKSQRPKT